MQKELRMEFEPLGRKIHYELSITLSLLSLFLVALVIAPLIHELLHIIILKTLGYYYNGNIEFTLENGIYGKLEIISEMNFIDVIIFLGIGILGNFIFGSILFINGFYTRVSGKTAQSSIPLFTGLGFLTDPMSYLFSTSGDLINILNLLGVQGISFILPLFGFFIFISISLYLSEYLTHFIAEYKKIDEIERDIENFIRFLY
ncbi:MAG: hypothetical protein DRO95_02860 [Candidatus Altiarchaeales archaeon]|nr:MAG: hypothetical protein DRO95_02860 [Candidatus Altiarchaeales archaeon]